MAEATLTGAQRAAIFLLGVGEEAAAAIMRHMEPREVQRVGEAMASLAGVSNAQVEEVLREFHQEAGNVNPLAIGASDFTQRVMVQALGESKARTMLSKVLPGKQQTRGIEALKWMDARAVAEIIEDEHPQIIAIVLASLDDDHAAQVLAALPEALRPEAMLRVARLEIIDPAAMEELDQVLERQLGKVRKSPPRSVNGMTSAAAILNNVDTDMESVLLTALREADNDLGEKVSELMFVFEDLLDLDDRGMQRLIREIAVDNLVIALKGVDDAVREKFFSNMSSRAADMLKEDIEAKGPVKLSEVELAQKEVLSVATRLADEGELALGKGGDDFVCPRRYASLAAAQPLRARAEAGGTGGAGPGCAAARGLRGRLCRGIGRGPGPWRGHGRRAERALAGHGQAAGGTGGNPASRPDRHCPRRRRGDPAPGALPGRRCGGGAVGGAGPARRHRRAARSGASPRRCRARQRPARPPG